MLLDYALALRAKGFIAVPLVGGGKHLDLAAMGYRPVHLATRRKVLKELAFTGIAFTLAQCPPPEETVRRWFAGDGGNLGILGGAGDLVILDFDSREVFERWRDRHAALVGSTPVELTPRGAHVYVRCPQPTVSSSMHFGFRRAGHIKALGGYAVSAPSRLRDGSSYSWVEGRSLLDVEPQIIGDLQAISLHPASPAKRWHDRLLRRGYFEPE
ncbi:MAG: bifunctional DNA primase/polymerase [Bauldia sp.]